MTLPRHTIKVPRRVVEEVFGSEMELIAAVNRITQDLNGHRLLDGEETVVVSVPAETWERFRDHRGTMEVWKLRSAIMLAIVDRTRPRLDERQPGTLMIAQKETECPFCGDPVEPESPMVNTYALDGTTQAVHVRCANREGIPYKATAKLRDGLVWLKRRAVAAWLEKQVAGTRTT